MRSHISEETQKWKPAHEVRLTLDGGGPPVLERSRSKEGMCGCRYKAFYGSGIEN